MPSFAKHILLASLAISVSACTTDSVFGKKGDGATVKRPAAAEEERQEKIWDLFVNTDDPNTTIAVNKYIWNAALDVLDFLPVEAADPFSGVIVMGWGSAKGSGQQYRATIYVQDPALDARSLKVALMTRSGPAPRDTVRAIEDAILTRARQMRIEDSRL